MSKPDLSEVDQCLGLASRQAARTISRVFERHFRGAGIRSTQFSLLVQLMRRGPLSIGELAQHLGIERTTLTRNVALVEKKGLVDSAPGEDARSRIISVTRKGQAAVAAALPKWHKAQAATVEAVGKASADALRAMSADLNR